MANEEQIQHVFLYFSLLKRRQQHEITLQRRRRARRRLDEYIRRRRRVFTLFVLHLMLSFQQVPVRELWKRPRSNSFWEETCQGWAHTQWRENLRMSRRAFEYLCHELSPHISRRDTNFRKAIPVRQRVAITLYRLADTAQYRTIANLFGVGKSTVCGIVKEVCQAIIDILLPRYIRLPQGREEIQEKIDGMRRRAGFPQAVAALDGCHIAIIALGDSPEDFINRKGFHSMLLQALVDSSYLFLDICVGWPGRVHISRLFKNSILYGAARAFLPHDMCEVISGLRVPPLILGDSAYPLQDWLMKPYTDRGNLTQEQVQFNNSLSVTRVVLENAFGRLKGRFRCIGKRLDLSVTNACTVTAACCVLHNYCETHQEDFDQQWLDGIELNNEVCPGNLDQRQDRNALGISDAIKHFLR